MELWRHLNDWQRTLCPITLVAGLGEPGFRVWNPAFLGWLAVTGSDRWRFQSSPALLILYATLAALTVAWPLDGWVRFMTRAARRFPSWRPRNC
jgi:hypothetical protein